MKAVLSCRQRIATRQQTANGTRPSSTILHVSSEFSFKVVIEILVLRIENDEAQKHDNTCIKYVEIVIPVA